MVWARLSSNQWCRFSPQYIEQSGHSPTPFSLSTWFRGGGFVCFSPLGVLVTLAPFRGEGRTRDRCSVFELLPVLVERLLPVRPSD